ncbi:DUF2637 domain-containing protein [Pseudonocardia humida]|uniref:DUF2637 domain-containing protein n=1 Tax=Pseudonocardia humida TaxID=2800819 RepID=A0ABT1A537_9PSEU|nr:DUF2637 domain-containing protein [Pseudonocardia humida]MCO1658122.1 hypothetical protein [Pseudonocardia humida]
MTSQHHARQPGRLPRAMLWLPGLVVALGAAIATVHGLYEVAAAAGVPAGIAWLYPLITDGLALVAYTATARLVGPGRRYAWIVVALAAGLSGLAQAVYLANPVASGDAELAVDPVLRFGVGAWPAVAAAIVAHLLYLLAVEHPDAAPTEPEHSSVQPVAPAPELSAAEPWTAVQRSQLPQDVPGRRRSAALNTLEAGPVVVSRAAVSPARDRAAAAAASYVEEHGHVPTVSELERRAQVSRGTAATVLKDLRN